MLVIDGYPFLSLFPYAHVTQNQINKSGRSLLDKFIILIFLMANHILLISIYMDVISCIEKQNYWKYLFLKFWKPRTLNDEQGKQKQYVLQLCLFKGSSWILLSLSIKYIWKMLNYSKSMIFCIENNLFYRNLSIIIIWSYRL